MDERSRTPAAPLRGRLTVVRRATEADADLLVAWLRFLVREAGRARVTVDPYLWNEAGIRGWERAGFRPVERREPDEWRRDPWLLMVFDDEPASTLDARPER